LKMMFNQRLRMVRNRLKRSAVAKKMENKMKVLMRPKITNLKLKLKMALKKLARSRLSLKRMVKLRSKMLRIMARLTQSMVLTSKNKLKVRTRDLISFMMRRKMLKVGPLNKVKVLLNRVKKVLLLLMMSLNPKSKENLIKVRKMGKLFCLSL